MSIDNLVDALEDELVESIQQADRIVFLGFAFHRQNLKLLETRAQGHVQVLATTYGISQSDQSVIRDEVAKDLLTRKWQRAAAGGHRFGQRKVRRVFH